MRGAPVPRRRARRRRRPFLALLLAFGVAATPLPLLSRSDGTRGKTVGVVVTSSQSRARAALTELARVQELGANTAGLTTFWEADQETSSVGRGAHAPSDTDLALVMRRANDLGMRIALEPMLKCYGCRPAWRGAIRPRDRAAFFESYRAMINHYAEMSEQHGVDLFFVGSEMSTLQGYGDEWREVIRQARERYSGTIVYETNWDAFDGVPFWDAVDVVGVSAYFPLSEKADPSLSELKAAWKSPRPGTIAPQGWFQAIQGLAASTGKPIIFGEVGYRSVDHATRQPWAFDVGGGYNANVQVNAYQALLETFESQPWWMGVLWWEWLVPYSDPDVGFTPRDKPAERFLKRWWSEGWRPTPDDAARGGSETGPGAGASSQGRGGDATTGGAQPDGAARAPGEEGGVGGIVFGTDGTTGARSPADVVRGDSDHRTEIVGLTAAAGLLLVLTGLLVRREVVGARRRRAALPPATPGL